MATTRQMATIKDVLENKLPISVAMKKNGYTDASAKNPSNLTRSDAWQQMVTEHLPDYKVLKTHEEALQATKLHGTDDDFVEIPDHQTRLKAVEMAYKLKGKYIDNHGQSNTQINISVGDSGYVPPSNVLGIKPTTLKYSKPPIVSKTK